MIPSELTTLQIVHEPVGEQRIYTIFSEQHNWRCDVELDSPRLFGRGKLIFKSTSGIIVAPFAVDRLNLHFTDENGASKGQVKEAGFSVAGKSIVEDEHGNLIGKVVYSIKDSQFLGGSGEELGRAKRTIPKNLPFILGPSQAHLVDHFTWSRTSSQPCDERLIYCFVCHLVIGEFSSASG